MASDSKHDWVRTLLIILIVAIIVFVALWIMCMIPPEWVTPPSWCGLGAPPWGNGSNEPPPPNVECENLDDKLEITAKAWLTVGHTACTALGGQWYEMSKIVGCFDPHEPGRIDCLGVEANQYWQAFKTQCATAGGDPFCSRKFIGCVCPDWPVEESECGWRYSMYGGLRCGGVCPKGGVCTQVDQLCLCKEGEHIFCDEYIYNGDLTCLGGCDSQSEYCEYRNGVCDCWSSIDN